MVILLLELLLSFGILRYEFSINSNNYLSIGNSFAFLLLIKYIFYDIFIELRRYHAVKMDCFVLPGYRWKYPSTGLYV